MKIEQIKPVLDRIVIKEIKQDDLKKEGQGLIYIPESDAKERISCGEVLALGETVVKYQIVIGDTIMYQTNHGVPLSKETDEVKHRMITEIDVLAIIKE